LCYSRLYCGLDCCDSLYLLPGFPKLRQVGHPAMAGYFVYGSRNARLKLGFAKRLHNHNPKRLSHSRLGPAVIPMVEEAHGGCPGWSEMCLMAWAVHRTCYCLTP